ncbi:MAG: STAS domain-containing protein [Planctomycetota bacterium]
MEYIEKFEAGEIIIAVLKPPKIADEELTVAVSQELQAVASELQGKKVILNLDAVRHMNSRMIGELVRFIRVAKGADIDLRLCCSNERLQELIRLFKLGQLVKVFELEKEAVASYSKKGWFRR